MNSLSLLRELVFGSILVIPLALAAGCADEQSAGVKVPDDAWYNAPPTIPKNAEVIPPESYHLVPPARFEEAAEFLGSASISQISPGEIEYFAGQPVDMPGVTRPFLIRALYRSTPEFTIRILDNAFWVSSHDDPNDTAPVKRQPLVLVMEEVPETVFVTVGK